jgi:pimeloyl-ACP methyl ester carboxylesterase
MTPAAATEPEVVEAYTKAAVRVEEKTPTGPQLDMVILMPLLNPRLMPVPTMLIHGEYDDVADLDGLLPFFQQLPNPCKRYVVMPNAGHMMPCKAAIACSSMRSPASSRGHKRRRGMKD